MNKTILTALVLGGFLFLTSCVKNEKCVCANSADLTEADAKDNGVTLETACELARNGDETCLIQ